MTASHQATAFGTGLRRARGASPAGRLAFFEYAPDALVLLDSHGEAVEVSPSYRHLLGYGARRRCAMSTAELIHPEDLPRWRQSWSEVLAQPAGNAKVIVRARHARGEWRQVEVALINRLADSRIGGVVAVLSDTAPPSGHRDHLPLPDCSAEQHRVVALLGEMLARRGPSGQVLVLVIRLDQLHLVVRAFGRGRAHELLAAVLARLRSGLRDCDDLGMLDQDQLVVVCETQAGRRAAGALARRVSAVLSEPFHLGSDQVVLTASIGISAATSDSDAGDAARLLADADLAMSGAAARGGKRWALFDPAERSEAFREVTLPAALREALADGQFVVHYQPVVELDTGEPVGAEALVRWARPDGSLAGPDSFIAAAERSGVILELGAWVLQEACRTAAGWCAGPDGPCVAVNVSARQLEDPKLAGLVKAALADSGLQPARLALEVTESVLVADLDAAKRRLQGLRRLGVRVAIDDFGTGYSSLAYLRGLHVDTLKIDRCFVETLSGTRSDSAIVAAVLGLAEAFELDVVAEGVETETQAAELRRLGCPHAQGYLYGRPLPVDRAGTLLATHEPSSSSGQASRRR